MCNLQGIPRAAVLRAEPLVYAAAGLRHPQGAAARDGILRVPCLESRKVSGRSTCILLRMLSSCFVLMKFPCARRYLVSRFDGAAVSNSPTSLHYRPHRYGLHRLGSSARSLAAVAADPAFPPPRASRSGSATKVWLTRPVWVCSCFRSPVYRDAWTSVIS